jgi:hypothetical protein
MAGKSDYLENALLDHVYGGGDYTRPATVYLALFTAAPSDSGGGTEVSGNNYARKSVTNNSTNFPAASGGSKTLHVKTTFAVPSGSWGTVTHFGIFDASSAGNLLGWAALTASKTISSGDDVYFDVDQLVLTED